MAMTAAEIRAEGRRLWALMKGPASIPGGVALEWAEFIDAHADVLLADPEPTTVWAVEAHGFTVAIAADQATADAIAARRGSTVEEWRVTTAEDYRPTRTEEAPDA